MVSTNITAPPPSVTSTPAVLNLNVYHILAGKLFDSRARKLVTQQCITVDKDSGVILKVQDVADFWSASERGAWLKDGVKEEILNCSDLTILPGFVDAHVHSTRTYIF